MEEKRTPETIDYLVHEGIVVRQERHIKRLWILCIVIFAAFIATNAGWIIYESQWQDEVITQEIQQDSGQGGSNSYNGKIVGGDWNGEADDQDNSQEKNTEDGR